MYRGLAASGCALCPQGLSRIQCPAGRECLQPRGRPGLFGLGFADKYAGFLPESFRASIVETCERSISAVLSDNAVVLADAIVQKVLAPLLTPVISVVLFFVAFALLRMLVSMLVTVLGLVNRLPVIGTVNRWLGWVTGCVASTMDIYLVLCVVWAVIVITGGNLTVLNDTVMSSSLYYKAFNLFNPFL